MADGEIGVEVKGKGTAEVAVFPQNYFEHAGLKLFRDEKAKTFSIDEAGAKKNKTKANAPLEYVKSMQADLIKLNYLKAGANDGVFTAATARAVKRFQRHAKRVYRMPGPKDVAQDKVFPGPENGICDQATAKEIRVWIDSGFVNPVGRFPLRKLTVAGATKNQLRTDAADEWEAIVKLVADAGGILTGEKDGYGDTVRGLQKPKTLKVGASALSFHYCGRAVDIDQAFTGSPRRYFVKREDDAGGDTFWRIFCKTEKQDGTQGTEFKKGDVKHVPAMADLKEADIPAGFYIDMTALIESRGTFTRIKAQKGFNDSKLPAQSRYNKTEWWHFQYKVDIQPTFLDEIELIGKTEADGVKGGWTIAELDSKPG